MSGRVRKSSDYEVGYGRPPIATRFAAGNRANPNGRPRGSRSVGAILQDIMRQKIAVSENGKTRRIPTLEVILRRLANDAMRGNQRALKLLMEFLHRYGAEVEGTVRTEEVTSEDLEILSDYLEKTRSSDSDSNDSPKEGDDRDGESL
jgi:Family of unknown function (DUF5681)